ncbi:ABC transporter substrate-binding protein [Undibacterium sp. SXout7W]|uniref:ABC transporter substrate-binding protein n=1 Tax=Undibacterium sp. SXout7W TaxID=3413049 RepID=UPI003BF0F677
MMTSKRVSLCFLLLASFLPGLALSETRPIRIGWVYAMANAPALIADKKGYFVEEGLKVELKSFGDGPVVQQALSAGELDMAYVGAPPVFQWFSRGLNSRILAKVNYGQAALIARSKSSVRTLADLRGKKIASVAKGSGMDILLRGYVVKELAGLDPEKNIDIMSMPVGNMNTALDRGLVDAAFTWEPFVSDALLRGNAQLVLDVNQKLPQYPWYVVMAVPRTLAERPDDVIKVLRAHKKAIAFLNNHIEESNRIIAEAFQIAPIPTSAGKTIEPVAVVNEARKRLGWAERIETNDIQFIQRLINYSYSLGFMSKTFNAHQVIDSSFLLRAEQSNVKR